MRDKTETNERGDPMQTAGMSEEEPLTSQAPTAPTPSGLTAVPLSGEQRFQVILTEMELLQGRFDKYDDLIWRNRGWLVGVVVALVGWGLAQPPATRREILLVGLVMPVVFWIHEGMTRYVYWFKYVTRYRLLRSAVNDPTGRALGNIPLYDLANSANRKGSDWRGLFQCFAKGEPFIFHVIMLAVAAMAYLVGG